MTQIVQNDDQLKAVRAAIDAVALRDAGQSDWLYLTSTKPGSNCRGETPATFQRSVVLDEKSPGTSELAGARMIRFTVVWHSEAQDELASIWLDAADRQSVTLAANAIDRHLATDATAKGI